MPSRDADPHDTRLHEARLRDARALCAFIDASPSPYHAVATVAGRLTDAGFEPCDLDVDDLPRTGFVRRGGAFVAWVRSGRERPGDPYVVVGAHTDSPGLRLKPRPDTGAQGWRQLAVEIYGGALLNSWLDRDLGAAGRLVTADGAEHLVRIDRPLARVPQLAIHLDRTVSDGGLVLDKQLHLTPVWGLGEVRDGAVVAVLARAAGIDPATVAAFDIAFHDLTPAGLLGADDDFVVAGRLDDLCSVWCGLDALERHAAAAGADARGDAPTAVLALFDHEEVGSSSTTGAAGPMLGDVLARLGHTRGEHGGAHAAALARSRCISADMAHAVHPNYPERHEPGHRPLPNAGPVIKVNANQRYATDATTAAWFRERAAAVGVPVQWFVARNSMPCGSTIGPITATRLGIPTVDVGCAQLSMHSARELCGSQDPAMLRDVLVAAWSG